MISVEDLKYLDTQIWVRSGEECAKRLFTTQSTVSRRNTETLKIFGLKMKRDKFGEWVIEGNTKLLNMERQVHQEYRLNKDDEKLRLEANFWAGPTLSHPSPEGWVNGVWDHIGMDRPLHLLREGIIDAWIGSYQPDLPDKNDPDLIVIDLCKNPVKLVEDKLHPLSDKENICTKDLEAYPSLSLPEGWFPRTEAKLRSHGLWSTEARMKKYKKELWEDKTSDQVTLGYATCLGLEVMKNLIVLNYDLDLLSGESLVIKKELMDNSKMQSLLTVLKSRIIEKSKKHPELILSF